MTNFENQEKTFVVGEDLIDDLLEKKNKPVKEAVVLVIDDENEFDDLI